MNLAIPSLDWRSLRFIGFKGGARELWRRGRLKLSILSGEFADG